MKVDLLVVGGGSAGYAAANLAAANGASCALVESARTMGGTCILRGCMPSKALIESANRCRIMREGAAFGLDLAEPPQVAWERIQDRKRTLIDGFQEARREELTEGAFTLLRGQARFLDCSRVIIESDGETRTVEARQFIIATGSEPVTPDVPGLDQVQAHTSDSLLELQKLPSRLVVVGGGAIGLEYAHCFEGLGASVAVVQRSERILTQYEPEVSTHLAAASTDRGIELLTGHHLESVHPHGEGVELELSSGQGPRTLRGDTLLLATGRRPRTEDLELGAAGVDVDESGRILIDRRCRTSAPNIFAAGDCASPFPVVHLAVIQGEVAAGHALVALERWDPGNARRWNPAQRMTGVFTEPEVVQIGFSASEAQEQGEEVISATSLFAELGKGQIKKHRHGFVKLVARKDDGRLLGASAVGELAVELSHGVMVALHQGMDVQSFARVPHYHPTLVEIWLSPAEELAAQLS